MEELECFFVDDSATTESYTYVHTLSLNDALPICCRRLAAVGGEVEGLDRLAGRRLQLAAEASLNGEDAVTAFVLHRRFRPLRQGRAASAALSRWRVTAATSNDELGEIGRAPV